MTKRAMIKALQAEGLILFQFFKNHASDQHPELFWNHHKHPVLAKNKLIAAQRMAHRLDEIAIDILCLQTEERMET